MSSITVLLNEISESLFQWALFMNLWIGALFLLALVIERVLRGHISATNRMLLYAPVFIRLVLPIGWDSPLSFTPELFRLESSPNIEQTSLHSLATQTNSLELSRIAYTPLASSAGAARKVSQVPSPVKNSKGWGILLVYLLGVGMIGVYRVFRYKNLRKFLKEAFPSQRDRKRLPSQLLPSKVRLLEHERIGPLVHGIVKPTIVVPTAIMSSLSDAALSCVIAHEVEHLKRRDAILSLVTQTVTLVLWPVLALWFTARRLHRLAEVACDDAAIRRLPHIGFKSYGEVLLRVADFRSLEHRFVRISNGFIGSELQERIVTLGLGYKLHSTFQKGFILTIALVIIASSGVAKQSAFGQYDFSNDRLQDLSHLELADIELKFEDAPEDLHLCQQLVQGYSRLASDWYNRFRSAYSAGHIEKMDEYLEKTNQMSHKAWHYAKTLIAPYEEERLNAMRSGEEAFNRWLNDSFGTNQASVLLDIGTAWITSIVYSDQLHNLIDIRFAEATLVRAVELEPSLLSSQGLVVLGMAKCKVPGTIMPEVAQQGYVLLQSALRLTNAENQMIRVNIAEYCAPALGDRELFLRSLQDVLNSTPNGRFIKSNQRARELSEHLMEEVDVLFPDSE